MAALAGHQADALDTKHAGDGLELWTQGLKLQIDEVGAVQIDRIALIAADLPAQHVDAVLHQKIENVAQDADAVLTMDFDAHGSSVTPSFSCSAQKFVKIS